MITPFINDDLPIGKVAFFLEHVNACSECREELEVYFTLLTAIRQLNEDEDFTSNYHDELIRKIDDWEDRLRRRTINKYKRRFAFLFVIISVSILFSIELGEKIIGDQGTAPVDSAGPRVAVTHKVTYKY